MGTKRITELPSATSVGNSDVLHIVQNGIDKKATLQTTVASVSSRIDGIEATTTASASGSGLTFSFKKKNGIVRVSIGGSTSSAITANTSIGTIPTGYVPDSSFEFAAYNGSTPTNVIPCILGSDGTIKFRSAISASIYVRGSATYIL